MSNRFLKVSVIFIWVLSFIQVKAQLLFTNENTHDYGTVEQAESLMSVFLVKNNLDMPVFILRADADQNLQVHTSKKKLLMGDTATLTVIFVPQKPGKFNCRIDLVISSSDKKQEFYLKGKVNKLSSDFKRLCYTFADTKPVKREFHEINFPPPKFDSVQTLIQKSIPTASTDSLLHSIEKETNKSAFTSNHKSNNLVFLLDISASMRDSLKLPVMKKSIIHLVNQIRDQDKISLVVYNDSLRILEENINASDRERIIEAVSRIKARGSTKGAQAILFAADLAVRNYIAEGNNQLILATDGEFSFYDSHYKKWFNKIEGKQIGISVVALGNDKKAQRSLKLLSLRGGGTYLSLRGMKTNEELLLQMILQQSVK